MGLMADSAQEEATHGDVDHGLGDVDPLLVVAHEAAPPGHPTKGALDHPAPWQHLEAWFGVDAADDLYDEVEEGGLVHECCPVIGAIGEQMLDPWPALADCREDRLGASAVGDIGGGEVDHQEAAVGIDDDMPLAADDLLTGVVAARFSRRRLHRLAVGDAGGRAGLAAGALAVHHQRDVMDGAEQQQPDEAPEPPVDRLPGWKILGQHAPAAARTRHVANGVQNLAQINTGLASALRRSRQQGSDALPFRVRQVRRVALGLLLDGGDTAACLGGPHPQLESHRSASLQAFSNSLLGLQLPFADPERRAPSFSVISMAYVQPDGAAALHPQSHCGDFTSENASLSWAHAYMDSTVEDPAGASRSPLPNFSASAIPPAYQILFCRR